MSAPDTNIKAQAWYHRPSLIGMAVVLVGALVFVFGAQLAPDDDAALTEAPIAATE
ncbi:hypothetical protein [uncultured Tateyamaria sp.]|uniref:hypothetical protein n=1 Tax=uncultured Tateyamaria sp. TaxID=455651 RepID=UPI002611C492|nr:hypothetical protein [uncultured Tateyamaria sp.]